MLSCCGSKEQQDNVVDPVNDKNAFRQPPKDDADAMALFMKEKNRKREEARARGEIVNNVDENNEKSSEMLKATKAKEMEEIKAKSILTIQSTVRMFLGKCKRKYVYHEAFGDLEEWLEEKNKWLAYEGKRRGAIITARKGFILRYINALFSGAVSFFAETDAVLTVQRLWRGYSSRTKYPFIRKIKIKLIKYEPRYGPEVYRRLWARRHFEPEGGWRIDKRTPYYDMWSHIDQPPKGESYGVRSLKILANDASPTSVKLLTEDKNSWIGFQTVLLTKEELAPKLNESQKQLLTSPLAHRAKKKKIVQVVPEVPEHQKADAFFDKVRREKAIERMQKRAEYAVKSFSRGSNRGSRQGIDSRINMSASQDPVPVPKLYDDPDDSNIFTENTVSVNTTHENERMPEEDWENDTCRESYWTKKFKRLFVTPLRGTRKPTPFTHRAAQVAAIPPKIVSRKQKKGKPPSLSQSVGVTSRKLISSILLSTEGRENKFGTMEASKRISIKNLVSYEKAKNVLRETNISEYALAFDHGKAMIEEQKRRAIVRKTGGTTFMELPKEWWHENKSDVGELVGYIRYDTQERWNLCYDDFGREYYMNSSTQETSSEPPQNPHLPSEEDSTTIPSHEMHEMRQQIEQGGDSESLHALIQMNTPSTASPTSLRRMSTTARKSSFMGKNVGPTSPKPKQQPFGHKIGQTLRQYQGGKQPNIDFIRSSSNVTPYLALNQHGRVDDGSVIFSPSSPANNNRKRKSTTSKKYVSSEFSSGDDDNSSIGPAPLDPDAFKATEKDILEETIAYKNTPWARLKDATLHLVERVNQLAQTKNQESLELSVPMKQKKSVESRVKIWKTKPISNFYFKHTWLPQPMVGEAAKDVHWSPTKTISGLQNYGHGPSSPSIRSNTSSPRAMIPGGASLAFEDSMVFDHDCLASSHAGVSSSASHFNYLKSNTYNTANDSIKLRQSQKPRPVKTQSRFERFMNRYIYQKSMEQRDKSQLHSFAFK